MARFSQEKRVRLIFEYLQKFSMQSIIIIIIMFQSSFPHIPYSYASVLEPVKYVLYK
jgi:hypothetical protein